MSQLDQQLGAAQAMFAAGDPAAALAALDGLQQPAALALSARIRCALGEHLAAIKLLRAEAAMGESAACLLRMGLCWQHLAQWEAAEKALRRAVMLDGRDVETLIQYATALYQLDRHGEAVRALERAILLDPRAKRARYDLAQICIELGDLRRALSQLHLLQAQFPDDAPTHRLQAALFLKLKDYRQALVELCWLVESEEADSWCYSSMGLAYRAIDEKSQALRAYECALDRDPSLAEEAFLAAQLNEELGRDERALERFRALVHDLSFGPEAQASVRRLEERLLAGRPAVPSREAEAFRGFRAPEVAPTALVTPPLEPPGRAEPLDMDEVAYAGPAPLLERLKRNLADATGGRLDLDEMKDRAQDLLERVPLDALKEKLPEALKRHPLQRFFGGDK